ncbi:MAG: DNA topoisomerase [Kofleriaceae bacterium]
MELVVAEKPSVAREIARVLGVRPSGKDAFEGSDYVITWCIGHLVELDEPAAYDAAWKSWRLEALPMLPSPFRLRAAPHAVGHLRAVRALLRDRRFVGVIDACDAGREGELIFRYVYQYAGARLPVRRLWISSMTDEAIRRGFAHLRPSAQMDPLADAARSRSEADWLVGMNATRAVTVRNRAGGHTSLYSIGRVQTPTLAMIVAREQQIRAFVPRDYWEVRAQLVTADGATFAAAWRRGEAARLGSAALAETIVARDRAAGDAVVERVRAKTVREAPPLLFDLTSLQRTANRRFGFTATRTLELAQALYERHKVLTYPRTDSRHLSNDLVGELAEKFRSLAAVAEYAPFAEPLLEQPPRPSRRVFDDAKVHDHHAIIPTGATIRIDALDRDERRLFDLVVRRFLGAFHGDAEFAVTEAWIRVAGPAGAARPIPDEPHQEPGRGSNQAPRANQPANDGPVILAVAPPPPDRYLARGRVRLAAGWQAVAGIEPSANHTGDDAQDDREATALLPALVEGQRLDGTYASRAKQTMPPPRYTEATLLGAMESAGKAIDDETLRAAMRDSGLGTPATRASIIETLVKRDYIVRERQHLAPTETGTGLIEALPVASLASPELTGTWEARLSRIARGEDSRAAFMADIARYVTELVDTIRTSTPAPPPANQPESAFGGGGRGGRGGRGSGRNGSGRRGGSQSPRSNQPRRESSRRPRGPNAPAAPNGPSAPSWTRPPASQLPPPGRDDRAARVSPPIDVARAVAASSQPTNSRIDLHQDASIVAALRATSRSDSPPPQPRTAAPAMPRSEKAMGPSAASPIRTTATTAPPPPRNARRSAASTAKSKAALAELTCPRCHAGTLLTGSRGWGCSRWREDCRFVIWFEYAGKRLTRTQLRDLVTRGQTREAEMMIDGVKRAGCLVLDARAATPVAFQPR